MGGRNILWKEWERNVRIVIFVSQRLELRSCPSQSSFSLVNLSTDISPPTPCKRNKDIEQKNVTSLLFNCPSFQIASFFPNWIYLNSDHSPLTLSEQCTLHLFSFQITISPATGRHLQTSHKLFFIIPRSIHLSKVTSTLSLALFLSHSCNNTTSGYLFLLSKLPG